jgi:hypothetical protein
MIKIIIITFQTNIKDYNHLGESIIAFLGNYNQIHNDIYCYYYLKSGEKEGDEG